MPDVFVHDREKHSYTLNGRYLYGVSSILRRAGLVDLSGIPEDVLERARQFGQAGHLMTELYDLGTLDLSTVHEALLPYLEGWKNFKRETGYEVVEIEKAVYSKRWWYGGTPDRWLRREGRYAIPDIKFTAAIYPPNQLQVAFYDIAKQEMTGIKSDRMAVQLTSKPPYFKIHPFTDESDYQTVMGACQTSKFKKKHGGYYDRQNATR